MWDERCLEPVPEVEHGSVLILKSGEEIIARDLKTNTTARAKCHPDDKFDWLIGAKLVLERLEDKVHPRFLNTNIVITKMTGCDDRLLVGHLYKVKNGKIIDEHGEPKPLTRHDIRFKTFEELKEFYKCLFECVEVTNL